MGAYISGLERIRDLDPKVLFPGHGPLIANPKRVLTEYIEHRKARHQKVLEAVKAGIADDESGQAAAAGARAVVDAAVAGGATDDVTCVVLRTVLE